MIIESRNRFTPLSLSPALWLSDTGSDPAVWEDLSGNSRNATQGTAANQPAIISNGLNGRQVRRFDGTNDFLTQSATLMQNVTGATLFAICKFSNLPTSQRPVIRVNVGFLTRAGIIGGIPTSNKKSIYARRITGVESATIATTNANVSTSNFQISTGVINYQTGAVSQFINGVQDGFATLPTTGNSENVADNTIVGADAVPAPSAFFQGDIAEILVFPTALSESQRKQVENYLSSKWGIPTYDSDALDYFTRVEAAGSTINADNKNAINQFIVGCKEDGNWSKIKASCILAGADTLSGALVPLVGTAPTNVGFLSSDYSPTGGLISNGTTKYLKSGRFGTSDPLNNQSLAVYHPRAGTSYNQSIGCGRATNASSVGDGYTYSQNSTISVGWTSPSVGLMGLSRSLSSSYVRHNNRVTTTVNLNSTGRTSDEVFVFGSSNGTGLNNSITTNWPISFYSIGESINLALLDTRLTQLMNSLRSSSYDADALAYFARIEAAGSTINESNKNAVNEFIIGCKEDGNWSKIKASCILAGADTLSGALQPLVGTAPTPFFFEESNYSRINGLISNGTTSYLNSNRNDNADTKDNASMCLCITQHSSENFYYASYTNFNGSAGRVLSRNGPSGVGAMCNNGGGSATVPHSRTTATLPAFVGISRSNPTDYSFRYGGVTDTVIKTSGDPQAGPIHIFKQGNNTAVTSYSDVRLSFYSIGESINLDLLDARITKLMNSLI